MDYYIRWALEPSTRRPGEMEKVPIHWQTGRHIDPHDAANRTSREQADASPHGAGVGIVITAEDPRFFLDIDKAYKNGSWSPRAVELCAQYQGCYIETSQSGTGLHIIGEGAGLHSCQNKPEGLELYTSGRFCALTGLHARGSMAFNAQAQLTQTINAYFPPAHRSENPAEWTDAPVPEWTGPTSDPDLIRKLMASKSSPFKAGASALALWGADVDALGTAYPDPRRPFDWSKADAALCQHLAFWTGKDCERMDRLFRMSGLYREKWEREDYRRGTILLAVGRCETVYTRKPKEAAAPQQDTRGGFQFVSVDRQIEMFKGCVYVRGHHGILCPDGQILTPEQFKVAYGGRTYSLDTIGGKVTRNAWEAFTQSQGYDFPKVHKACFRPELAAGEIVVEDKLTMVNTYVDPETPRTPGDVSRFTELVAKLLPNAGDRAVLLAYMAAILQYPGKKFFWAPLLQGVEGNGKSFFGSVMEFCCGYRYSHSPNSKDINNKFNPWLSGKRFINIEEVFVQDRQDLLDTLKVLITQTRIEIQGKGSDQVMGDNRANFIMCCNPRDALRTTKSSRRYCVLYTAQQDIEDIIRDGMGGNYFPDLYEWARGGGFAAINHWLCEYPIPPELNPAGACHRAPRTSSTDEAIIASEGRVEQEIREAVAQCRPGFCGGWISSKHLEMLCTTTWGCNVTLNKRVEILKALGYVPHPAWPKGRVHNMIDDCGYPTRPVLYARAGHIITKIAETKTALRLYKEAQSITPGGLEARGEEVAG